MSTVHDKRADGLSMSVAPRSDGLIVLTFYRGEDPSVTVSLGAAGAVWLAEQLVAAAGGRPAPSPAQRPSLVPLALEEMRTKYPATYSAHFGDLIL